MTRAVDRYTKHLIKDDGWRIGTNLENQVAFALSRAGWKPWQSTLTKFNIGRGPYVVHQQYPLLKYKLDFAWPMVGVCLEADGWYHRNLDIVDRDRCRDADLRAAGWWTFRVDWTAGDDALLIQVGKVSRLVRQMLTDATSWNPKEWTYEQQYAEHPSD